MVKHINCPHCNADDTKIEYHELEDYFFEPSAYQAIWSMTCVHCRGTFRVKETYSLVDIELDS